MYAKNKTFYVQAQSLGFSTYQQRYIDGNKAVFSIMTLVISVDMGAVIGASWDSGCNACAVESPQCQPNEFLHGIPHDGGASYCAAESCTHDDGSCDLQVCSWSFEPNEDGCVY